jgi:uncharacterized membrane protein
LGRRKPTVRRAISTCVQALIAVSHQVPLIGFIIVGVLVWLALWLRSHPLTSWEIGNRCIFWLVLIVAGCFLVLAVAGFIEAVKRRPRAGSGNANKTM